MGWKNAMSYVRKMGQTEPATQDTGLPLGARIGSLVGLQHSPLIRANANGSLIGLPEEGDTRIVAISQVKLNMSGGLYRYYLTKGDEDADEQFLQVYRDAKGDVAEVMYCTQLTRVIPETVDDQEAFTGEKGAGLGDRTYTLWREQLEGFGFDLDAVFGAEEQISFVRDAGHAENEFVPPFTGTETRIDDAGGVQGLKQEIYFMPYVRELEGGTKEYLLITTEIIASVNGDASKRGIHVDFVVGIPVEQERLSIQ